MWLPTAVPTMDSDGKTEPSGGFDAGTVLTVELSDAVAAEVDALIEEGAYADRAAAVRAAIRRASVDTDPEGD